MNIGIYGGRLFFEKKDRHKWNEHSFFQGNIGGSEAWAICFSRTLCRNGHSVTLFCDCEDDHVSLDGVRYVRLDEFKEVIGNERFDRFFISRDCELIDEGICAERTYLVLHDTTVSYVDITGYLNDGRYFGILSHSPYQMCMFADKFCTDINRFTLVPQGVDEEYYRDVRMYEKKNKMVWSSHKTRGAEFLIRKIFPLIRSEVPDFEIDVCGYVPDCTDDYFMTEGINVLGCLNKAEMARRQMESKIWIYPNTGVFGDRTVQGDTFCLTAVENSFAENALIVSGRHAFPYTLMEYCDFEEGHDLFTGTELFEVGEEYVRKERLDEYARVFAEKAVRLLKDGEYRKKHAAAAKAACRRYVWENVYKTYQRKEII